MNTPKSIQSLAESRIIEAEYLYAGGHYDMAFYLAGYAVELYLKSRICLVLDMPDFFDFGKRPKFENEDNITKPYKVHNFAQLLILAGLNQEQNKKLKNYTFKDDLTVLNKWKESQRYSFGKTSIET